MPYAALRNSLLDARQRRDETLQRQSCAGCGTIFISLNIPGPQKSPPGSCALLDWGRARLHALLPALRPLERGRDALGPWALARAEADPGALKEVALSVETALPAARLLDIDVYGPGGAPLDRSSLGLPQRPCLLCPEPARQCMRLGRHNASQLQRRVHELLAPFRP